MLKESYDTYTNIRTNIIAYNASAVILGYDHKSYTNVINGEVWSSSGLKEVEKQRIVFSIYI